MSNHPPSSESGSTPLVGDALDEHSAGGGEAFFFGVPRLTRDRLERLVKFGVVGVSGVLVNLVVFELFYRVTHLPFSVANAVGIVVSIFTNFVLNDVWTWGDRRKGGWRDWGHRLIKYYVSASAAALVQLVVAWASNIVVFDRLALVLPADWVPEFMLEADGSGIDLGPTLAVLTGIAAGMIINFVASHWWAFRDAEVEQ